MWYLSVSTAKKVVPFYFCVDVGVYTGVSATSYEDFLTSIKQVEARSLNFHLNRGDFERWTLDILKDEELAREIGKLKSQKLSGSVLRSRLERIVANRREEAISKTR